MIATFLRTYNDMLDDERRQDLYAFAANASGLQRVKASRYFAELRSVK